MPEPISDLGETPEHIAYRLLEMIIANDPPKSPQSINAAWILATYGRCLRMVRNPELPGAKPELVSPRSYS